MELSSFSGVWSKWNIRGFVILSLLLQIFLVLFASLRKKMANQPIVFLLWLAYLMADWIAAYTVGLISHIQDISQAHAAKVDGALQAFWASFILLHLGGSDTITAFSLEDSSLWRRHLLSIVFQVSATIYVFVQIFLSDTSLVIPTILVFFAGIIKNVERVVALYLSSLPRLKERMLLQNNSYTGVDNELIEELDRVGDGYTDEVKEKLAESTVVKHAYYFHRIFKFSRDEIVFALGEREMTRRYFHKVSAMDALRVISIQLQFIYKVLYTKALAIHLKWSSIFRFIAFCDIVMALVLFNRLKKHQFSELDVKITYILLFGGITVDVIALLMFIFSDWTIARIKWYKKSSSKLNSFTLKLVSTMAELRKPRFTTRKLESSANVTYTVFDTPLVLRRWSESIFACNLLSKSLQESPRKMYKGNQCLGIITDICCFPFHMVEKIISLFHQAGMMIAIGCGLCNIEVIIEKEKHVSKNPFNKELWIFIFKEVRRKSENADDLTEMKRIFEARGDLFLQSSPGGIDCGKLLEYVTQAPYGFSILIWHLATEIWYNREKQSMPTDRNDEREFSKILSDYMLYVFLNKVDLVSTGMDILQIPSVATLLQLQIYIGDMTQDVERLSRTLYEDEHKFGGLDPTSPLKVGIQLAREMERHREMKWKVMSGVWVEMLSFAAGHIKVEAHVQVPSEGGELLTFVWLLMVHLGIFHCQIPMPMPSP